MELDYFFNERRYSMIQDEFPCKIKYPKYYETQKTEYIIGPGQRLFIPAGWFHFVFSEGVEEETGLNMAINHWFTVSQDYKEGVSNGDTPYVSGHNIPNIDLSQYISDDEEVQFIFSPDGIYGTLAIGQNHFDVKFTGMKWGDYYKNKRTDGYMIQHKFPWLDQFKCDDIPPDREKKESTMWLNFGNVRTYIHYDMEDNFLCQIKGTKRVLLWPPEDRKFLYTFNPYSLDTVFKLERAWNSWDFVMRNGHSISNKPKIVEYILRRLGDDEFTEVEEHLFRNDYINTANIYHDFLRQRGCLPEYDINRLKFYATRGPGIPKLQNINSYVNIITFITQGDMKIGDSEFHMFVGSTVCFPNLFTYPWGITDDSVIVIAAEDQQSMQPEHSASPA